MSWTQKSDAGYHYIENNIAMCKCHIHAIPDDNNMKEINGINILTTFN